MNTFHVSLCKNYRVFLTRIQMCPADAYSLCSAVSWAKLWCQPDVDVIWGSTLSWCEVAYTRCEVAYTRCDVAYSRCDVAYIRCEVAYVRCEVAYTWMQGRCDVLSWRQWTKAEASDQVQYRERLDLDVSLCCKLLCKGSWMMIVNKIVIVGLWCFVQMILMNEMLIVQTYLLNNIFFLLLIN